MKQLNQTASEIFHLLIAGLNHPGESRTIDTTNSGFMPVSVEYIYRNEHGRHYSLAHYYEQFGDLMRDPEMIFLVDINNDIFPLTCRQDNLGIDQVAATANDGEPLQETPKLQRDLVEFSHTWLNNIKDQQHLEQIS